MSSVIGGSSFSASVISRLRSESNPREADEQTQNLDSNAQMPERGSAGQFTNPFANLPFPTPGPPLTPDPETDALLNEVSQNNANGQDAPAVSNPATVPTAIPTSAVSGTGGSGSASNLSIDIAFFNPDGSGNPNPGTGGVFDSPTEFIPRDPFNPLPRPFPSPVPFIPGPPMPAPPLTPPPEEDALFNGGIQSAGDASGAAVNGNDANETPASATDPIVDLFGGPIPFEPNGVPPGPDFFTDALAGLNGSSQGVDNARIQEGTDVATEGANEALSASNNGGAPSSRGTPSAEANTDSIDTAQSPSADSNSRSAIENMVSNLKRLLNDLLSMLRL